MNKRLVPKLRFPEFDGEWSFSSLENAGLKVIDGDRGKSYPNSDDFSNSGYCLFMNAKNFTKKSLLF